jgi:hypothetical protein
LDEDQLHLAAAFRAGHLNSGLKTRTGWRRSGYLHDILFSNGRDASKDITREPGFRSRQNVRVGTASTVLAEIDHSRFQNRSFANRRINLVLTLGKACEKQRARDLLIELVGGEPADQLRDRSAASVTGFEGIEAGPLFLFPFAFSPSNLEFGGIIAPVQFCYTGRSDIE